jgi:hypothetical protein
MVKQKTFLLRFLSTKNYSTAGLRIFCHNLLRFVYTSDFAVRFRALLNALDFHFAFPRVYSFSEPRFRLSRVHKMGV